MNFLCLHRSPNSYRQALNRKESRKSLKGLGKLKIPQYITVRNSLKYNSIMSNRSSWAHNIPYSRSEALLWVWIHLTLLKSPSFLHICFCYSSVGVSSVLTNLHFHSKTKNWIRFLKSCLCFTAQNSKVTEHRQPSTLPKHVNQHFKPSHEKTLSVKLVHVS